MTTIQLMIAHKLNINNPHPILRNNCIDISTPEMQEALSFFETHINNVMKQASTRRCQFNNLPDNIVKKRMSNILTHLDDDILESTFIDESKNLANSLSARIKETSSKSDGSLFILLFTQNDQNYLGILKMDPNDGVQINDDLSITVHKEMLPSPKEKLHKSALILLKEYSENELHLHVLDKQQSNKEPAQFFIDNFLNASELSSDKNITNYLQEYIPKEFSEIIEPQKLSVFDNKLRHRFSTGEDFNLDVDLEPIIRPLLAENLSSLDISSTIDSFKDTALKFRSDMAFTFTPTISTVKDTIFQTTDRNIEMKFSPSLQLSEDYTIETAENDDVIITLKNGIGKGLEEKKQ